jgi:hypothetical protein
MHGGDFMDENFGNNPDNYQQAIGSNSEQNDGNNAGEDNNVNRLSMDSNGKIRANKGGGAAIASNTKIYIILGWISVAFTAFLSPLFAIAGITFGILVNRQARGTGNVIIKTNIVLAIVNFMLRIFLAAYI